MTHFILRNTRTGWKGSVTERAYRRLIKSKEYVDPRTPATGDKLSPAAPVARSFEVVKDDAPPWVVTERSRGWYDVIRNGKATNEKAMRKAAAEALRDELNGKS